MKNTKTIKATFEGKKYTIEYRETSNSLLFIDKDGGKIGFVKSKNGLGVYVDNGYSQKMWGDYPSLKGFNPYFLLPSQLKIFMNWYFKTNNNKK
jgi:hypothetical protein